MSSFVKNIPCGLCKNCSKASRKRNCLQNSNRAGRPVVIEVSGFFDKATVCGTVLAIAWVGQRDTKWLVPLTVSAVTKGEER